MYTEDQERQIEHLKNLGVAAVSMVPVLGNPLSVLMDKYIPSYVERRRNEMLAQLTDGFRELSDRITPERLASDEYASVFIKGFRRAMDEHLADKLEAFRCVILNAALAQSSDFDELTLFLRLISDLTVDQIRILKLLQGNDAVRMGEQGLFLVMRETWPEADPDYLMACVTELLRTNLVSSNPKNKEVQGRHFLTGLGERFVAYISSPPVDKR